jgi:hypothetical protein
MPLSFCFVTICCLGPTEFLQVTACHQGVKVVLPPILVHEAKFFEVEVEAEEDALFMVEDSRGALNGARSMLYARHWWFSEWEAGGVMVGESDAICRSVRTVDLSRKSSAE